jgi:hypothetical protein
MYKKLLILFSTAMLISACSSETYISHWDENNISIDGNQKEWFNRLKYIEDEKISLGVYNNDENLYLCFTTDDKLKIMQIMNMGMTVWLIPGDSDVRPRGIKYPQRSEDFELGKMREKRLIGYERDYLKNLLEVNEQKQTEVQIVNWEDYSLYIYPINSGSGINIKLGENRQQLVYEISIPIGEDSSSDFSIALLPGDDLTIGFKTSTYGRPQRRSGSSQYPGGDYTGSGNSGSANRTGVPGVEIYSRPQPVDFEVHVTLAESP